MMVAAAWQSAACHELKDSWAKPKMEKYYTFNDLKICKNETNAIRRSPVPPFAGLLLLQ